MTSKCTRLSRNFRFLWGDSYIGVVIAAGIYIILAPASAAAASRPVWDVMWLLMWSVLISVLEHVFLLFIWLLHTLIPEHRTFNGHSKCSKLPGRWKGEDPGFLCLGASQNLAALRWLLVLGANRRVTAGRPRLENDHMCSPSFWACGGWPRPHDFSTQIYTVVDPTICFSQIAFQRCGQGFVGLLLKTSETLPI